MGRVSPVSREGGWRARPGRSFALADRRFKNLAGLWREQGLAAHAAVVSHLPAGKPDETHVRPGFARNVVGVDVRERGRVKLERAPLDAHDLTGAGTHTDELQLVKSHDST